jgi:aldose 1-epimerase
MAAERLAHVPLAAAQTPFPAGRLLRLGNGELSVDLAPEAGGRIAQIRYRGIEQLIGPDDGWPAMIAWGCYPMVPWAGRVRQARFRSAGVAQTLEANMGAHAIHGVGFALPWDVIEHTSMHAVLALALPRDSRWPYGGTARQSIHVEPDRLRLTLSVVAGDQPMPVVIGWHPWFRKPERLEFSPVCMYPRDEEGIATLPTVPALPGPWDDCFRKEGDVVLHRGGQRLQLESDCTHWVVFDQMAHATCVEPQSGPPDAFNLCDDVLPAGATMERRFTMIWDVGAD